VIETPLPEWNQTIGINLTAPFLLSQALAKSAVVDGRPARILNVSSQAAFNGSTTGHAHYAAAKSALNNFTLSLARELRGTGITVNAIALGLVETDMVGDALEHSREYYEKRTIIGRIATPQEIAGIMLFLLSDAAAYLTGSVFDATGGMISR
jgi:3-oxoacyl-[acyl-carrier protein] reductase